MAGKATAQATPESDVLEQRYGIELPYTITVRLRGVTPFLFNRMDIEAYDLETGPGTKRKPRSRPEYESMVWRDEDGNLAYPNRSIIASIVGAGRFYKSPIASNGSATNTLRDALVPTTEYAAFDATEWDAIDFRHAKYADMKKSPKPTYRPRLEVGWSLNAMFSVVLPQLYGPAKLFEIFTTAGTVGGIGDGRKIGFGRYVLDGHDETEGLPW
jgi:hypothetical protein